MNLLREKRKMAKKINYKVILPILIVFFMSIFLITPITMAYGTEYGTTYGTAVTKTAGIYDEEICAGDSSARYKIYCFQYANLSVDIEFNSSLYNLSLFIFNNSWTCADNSSNIGVDYQNCSIICNLTGFYYIKINTTNDSNWEFQLNITLLGGSTYPLIPGFEFIYIFISIILIICVYIPIIKRKNSKNNINFKLLPN